MYERSSFANGASEVSQSPAALTGVFVRRLVLEGFRTYAFLDLHFSEDKNCVVLHGKNGSGKTNLLEAVSFLTAGKGLRGAKLDDVARRGDVPVRRWTVSGVLEKTGETFKIGTGKTFQNPQERRRLVRINGEECKNQADLAHLVPMVWLTPSMDRLFSGEPSSRRRFFDRLCQCFDVGHAGRSLAYVSALRQYNLLLREGGADINWLKALEVSLAKYGSAILKTRAQVAALIKERLEQGVLSFPKAVLSDMPTADEDALRHCFEQARLNGQTALVAPHTTDLKVVNRDKNMPAHMCSTGEQKALLISVLLAHLQALGAQKGVLPVLLLDEAGAHLDAERKDGFFDYLKTLNTHVWLTGTQAESFEILKQNAQFFPVEDLLNDRACLNAAAS